MEEDNKKDDDTTTTTTINDSTDIEINFLDKASQTQQEEEEPQPFSVASSYDTLVLPGGALKGLYLLGAVQYCFDNLLLQNINTYIGTSSGAIISFLLAIGYTPVDIITEILTSQVVEKIQHFNIFAVINNLGATSFSFISEFLEKMTINKIGYYPTFADIKHKLNKHLVFVTYNLTKDEAVYLSYDTHPSLPCLVALRMSCNLPLIFDNFKYDNQYYVDGGIIDNFALTFALNTGAQNILAIHMIYSHMSFSPSDHFLQYIFKIIYIPILQQQKNKYESFSPTSKRYSLIDIEDVGKQNMFNFNINSIDKLNMFSSGYQQCKQKFER